MASNSDLRQSAARVIGSMALGLPHLGFGVGLRAEHIRSITSAWPAVDWFEILSENVMDSQGQAFAIAKAVAERYPVVLHGSR